MRKITDNAVKSFLFRKPFNANNTKVVIEEGIAYLLLHGNKIAALTTDHYLWVRNAGWFSNTTKERLNGLPKVHIYQRNHVWHLNDTVWNGKPVCVGKLDTDDIWIRK